MRDLDLNAPSFLDDSLVVSASAGSGKTFTLTVLVTATLGRGDLRPYEILATTFSEAATADLRERLLRPLDLLSTLDGPAWDQLRPLLGRAEAAAVQARLKAAVPSDRLAKSIQEVAQAFALWPEPAWAASSAQAMAFWRRVRREAELLQVSTIHGLALGLLAQGEGAPESILDVEHPALLRLLRQTVRERLTLGADHPDHAAGAALLAWAERNWGELSKGHDAHRDALGHLQPVALAPIRETMGRALDRAEALFRPLAADPERAVDRTSRYAHNFKPSNLLRVPEPGSALARRVRWAEKQSAVVKEKLPVYYSPAFGEAHASLAEAAEAWEAWLGALLGPALDAFERAKEAHGQGTFGDMVRRTLAGLEGGAIDPPRPRLLLVDECQDISQAQDAFLKALEAGRTVRVGDLKQAIYGFRGGDPELLRRHLEEAGDAACRLPANFRSSPEVVALANRFVDELWPRFDPAAGDLDGRQEATAQVSVPVGLVRDTAPSSGADLPALAGWIASLSREEGWTRALGGEARPKPRTRALLLTNRTRLPRLIRLLKAKGVQPYVVAKDGFWESPGVRLAMAAFEAVAHPERPAPCAALLRNLLGMKDPELWALAARDEAHPGLPGLGALTPEAVPEPYRDGARWLLELPGATTQELAGRLLVQGALLRTVNALKAHGAMEPPRARRNLAGFLSRVLDLPLSPVAAYGQLEEERMGKPRGDLPAAPEGADLLIQTVHGSKGLEYDDVLLPLLNTRVHGIRKGELRTDPATRALALVWKLGSHPGRAYRELKAGVEERERRDSLNLLYVGLTRAKERMCLLLQAPAKAKAAEEARNWAQWGNLLAQAHPQLLGLDEAPPVPERPAVPGPALAAPALRPALEPGGEAGAHDGLAPEVRARARQEGDAMHAYLQDLLVRWEDPSAFRRCLDAPPDVAHAKAHALRFLEAFEARGWRHLRRRTELPIPGAAASGAEGRADLVVWGEDAVHLLDFKHSKVFSEEDLAQYRRQLQRYASVLAVWTGMPVAGWLVPLKGGAWVQVELASRGPVAPD